MSQFNKAQVIMLPTEQKLLNTKTHQIVLSTSLFWTSEIEKDRYDKGSGWIFLKNNNDGMSITVPNRGYIQQHLYIISDDKIEEGDNIYSTISKSINVCNNPSIAKELGYKKIIATTDTSLKLKCFKCDDTKELDTGMFGMVDCDGCYYKNENKHLQLPQPSQQFIIKYIEFYNKGEAITDVLVKYENIPYIGGIVGDDEYEYFQSLKINTDNTITIKEPKNSWNKEELKEEVIKQLRKYNDANCTFFLDNDKKDLLNMWIKENL